MDTKFARHRGGAGHGLIPGHAGAAEADNTTVHRGFHPFANEQPESPNIILLRLFVSFTAPFVWLHYYGSIVMAPLLWLHCYGSILTAPFLRLHSYGSIVMAVYSFTAVYILSSVSAY